MLLIIFCGLLLIINLVGCMSKGEVEAKMSVAPTVYDWSPDQTFSVYEKVKKVDGLDMGRVILIRHSDNRLLSAMVIPMRDIPIRTNVKILGIEYLQGVGNYKDFCVVK